MNRRTTIAVAGATGVTVGFTTTVGFDATVATVLGGVGVGVGMLTGAIGVGAGRPNSSTTKITFRPL